MSNKAPPHYKKDGKIYEYGTGKVLRQNKDGSLNMTQFNSAITKFNAPGEGRTPGQTEGIRLDKQKVERQALSPYTGDNSDENWKTYFETLREAPLALSKAASAAGFERLGVIRHLSKHPKLKERYDDIMESELDNLEENIRDIAYESDPKYISTKLKANDTILAARAKDRGYGHQGGFNIGAGGDVNIQIVNNTGVSLPGQTEEAKFKEIKE